MTAPSVRQLQTENLMAACPAQHTSEFGLLCSATNSNKPLDLLLETIASRNPGEDVLPVVERATWSAIDARTLSGERSMQPTWESKDGAAPASGGPHF
jgi:hypothetical protein